MAKAKTFEELRDAIMAVWMRGDPATPDEIGKELDVSPATVRRLGRDYAMALSACMTFHPAESRGRGLGSSPADWRPRTHFLRGLLRGEGQRHQMHRYRVHIQVVTMARTGFQPGNKVFSVYATTETEARQKARDEATEKYGTLHSNTMIHHVNWDGKA